MATTTIGSNIKRLRNGKDLTQEELATKAGVTSVAMIEAGQITSPRADTMAALAKALGVAVSDLYAEPIVQQSPRKKSTTTHAR